MSEERHFVFWVAGRWFAVESSLLVQVQTFDPPENFQEDSGQFGDYFEVQNRFVPIVNTRARLGLPTLASEHQRVLNAVDQFEHHHLNGAELTSTTSCSVSSWTKGIPVRRGSTVHKLFDRLEAAHESLHLASDENVGSHSHLGPRGRAQASVQAIAERIRNELHAPQETLLLLDTPTGCYCLLADFAAGIRALDALEPVEQVKTPLILAVGRMPQSKEQVLVLDSDGVAA